MTTTLENLDQPNLNERLINPEVPKHDEESPSIYRAGVTDFFRFATKCDIFVLLIGGLFAFLNGWILPLFSLIFGSMTKDLGNSNNNLKDVGLKYALYFLYLGLGTWLLSLISVSTWMIIGEQQAIRFRIAYFKALLRQEVTWYDRSNPNEISTKVANDCLAVQIAISEKVSTITFTIGNIIGGFGVAIYFGWKLALILAALIILPMAIAGSCFVLSIQKLATANTKAYEVAGGYAAQALTEIRTVKSLNGEVIEINNYRKNLEFVRKVATKFGTISGVSLGSIFLSLFSSFAFGFWYGSHLVKNEPENYDTGKVLTIFFSLLNGMFSFGQIAPCLKALSSGKEALSRIIVILKSRPKIDIYDKSGEKPEGLRGEITFKNVTFSYPTRPSDKALNNFTVVLQANKKTALVGESGGGKSTCMHLIERFYDVEQGSLDIDGLNVKDLNLEWLRYNIGYVGQEPILFATTIRENLMFAKEDATEEELVEATKKAKAYEFIEGLEKKFETFVGPGGSHLSGGQKQRLAIARVILKNPKILLLDEATSALDRKNEKEIQDTLNKISEGKTTIIIAHRLSTVQNADNIILIHKGQVVDQGKHHELVLRNERYRNAAAHQHSGGSRHMSESSEEEEKAAEEHPNHQVHTFRYISEVDEDLENQEKVVDTFANQKSVVSKAPDSFDSRIANNQLSLLAGQASELNNPSLDRMKKPETIRIPSRTSNATQNTFSPVRFEDSPKFEFRKKTDSFTDPHIEPLGSDKEFKSQDFDLVRIEAVRTSIQKDLGILQIFGRLFKFNHAGVCAFLLLLFFSCLTGAILPIFAILFSQMLDILNNPLASNYDDRVQFISLMFVAIAFGMLIAIGFQSSLGHIISESISKAMRVDVYSKMLRMDIQWFDRSENGPGTLMQRLAADPSIISNLVGTVAAIVFQSISSLVIGLVVAFLSSWKVALITFAASPLSLIAGYFQQKYQGGYSAKNDEVYKKSGGFISEMVVNIRTVASFGRERALVRTYVNLVQGSYKIIRNHGLKAGTIFGLAQFLIYVMMSISFYTGIYYLSEGEITFLEMYTAIFALIFAAYGTGAALPYMSDFGACKTSGSGIFNILDSEIQITNPKEKEPIQKDLTGLIEFKNVTFKYPTRNQVVVKNLNLTIKPGQKVAFVGPSGCGKSTIFQLLLRFYDINFGEILVDGHNIKDYDIQHLRSQLGLVLQEPVLFNGTIQDNIK